MSSSHARRLAVIFSLWWRLNECSLDDFERVFCFIGNEPNMIRRESTQDNRPETRQFLMRLSEPADAEAALVETTLVPCKKCGFLKAAGCEF
jgi:hypothetical protein